MPSTPIVSSPSLPFSGAMPPALTSTIVPAGIDRHSFELISAPVLRRPSGNV